MKDVDAATFSGSSSYSAYAEMEMVSAADVDAAVICSAATMTDVDVEASSGF